MVQILFYAPSVTSGCIKKCSGIVGRLANNPLYVCPRCLGTARPIDGRPVTNIVVNGSELDAENKFYLGDMLSSGGGCNQAIKARCSVAWGKFRKLLPILTSKHIPLTVLSPDLDFQCSRCLGTARPIESLSLIHI